MAVVVEVRLIRLAGGFEQREGPLDQLDVVARHGSSMAAAYVNLLLERPEETS